MLKKFLNPKVQHDTNASFLDEESFKKGKLPNNYDAHIGSKVSAVLKYLLNHVPNNPTSAKAWYGLFQDLSETISEVHSQLELNIHLDVSNTSFSAALKAFEQDVLVTVLGARQSLTQVYLESQWKHSMHADDGGQIERDLIGRLPLAKPSLAQWQLKESQLVHKYKEYFNQLTVKWENRTVPLSVVNGYLHHPEEATRKEAFLTYWSRLGDKSETLENLFLELIDTRKNLAANANMSHFAECAFIENGRSSYTPKDCLDFSQRLLQGQHRYLNPLLHKIQSDSNKKSLNTGLPWNYQALSSCVAVKNPCDANFDALLNNTSKMLHKIHSSCGEFFDQLNTNKRLDILPRGGKAGGAFCVNFPKSKVPFVFGNFSTRFKDSVTLMHEFGHAFHSHLSSFIDNYLQRTPAMDFCEFASTVFEFLAIENLDFWFQDAADAKIAKDQHLIGVLSFFPLMSCIDEFQHRIYDPSVTLKNKSIGDFWTTVSRRHRSQIDWSQCPELENLGWLCRSHIFTSPFYFFEYGVAYLCALDFISQYKKSPEQSFARFLSALQLGSQRKLPELFKAAGVDFFLGPDSTMDVKKDPILVLEEWALKI